jgi:hypothetical protein
LDAVLPHTEEFALFPILRYVTNSLSNSFIVNKAQNRGIFNEI